MIPLGTCIAVDTYATTIPHARTRQRWRVFFIISPGKISEGETFATLPHTHRTAKVSRFRQWNIAPPSLKTKISHEIIPPLTSSKA